MLSSKKCKNLSCVKSKINSQNQSVNVNFQGSQKVSNIILNYKNDIPKFIPQIDIVRKIFGRPNIYDMAIGNPDISLHQSALTGLYKSSQNRKNHRYSMNIEENNFRSTIADWCQKRFNIAGLNPNKNNNS